MSVFNLKDTDFITSNNFARKSNLVFSEIISNDEFDIIKSKSYKVLHQSASETNFINTEFVINENDIIFCNTDFVKDLFNVLKKIKNLKNIKLITHWSDTPITKELFSKKPNCISKWYSPHIDFDHNDLISIPLGLSGKYSPKNLLSDNFLKFYSNYSDFKKVNYLYINFQKNTNHSVRDNIFSLFKDREWVKIDEPNLTLTNYLLELARSQFVLCPFGNGFDTHRVWETFYAGAIPIVMNHKSFDCTNGMKILKLENFENIDKSSLETMYKGLMELDENSTKLNINYWLNLIKENKINSNEKHDIKLSNSIVLWIKIKLKIKKIVRRNQKLLKFRLRQIKKILFK